MEKNEIKDFINVQNYIKSVHLDKNPMFKEIMAFDPKAAVREESIKQWTELIGKHFIRKEYYGIVIDTILSVKPCHQNNSKIIDVRVQRLNFTYQSNAVSIYPEVHTLSVPNIESYKNIITDEQYAKITESIDNILHSCDKFYEFLKTL